VKVSATSSGLVSVNNHLWSAWMKTAIEQAQRARQARGRFASYPWSPEQSPTAEWIAMLEQEFQASLVAVTASALALDALYGAAISEQLRGSGSKRPRRAGKIYESLKHAFDTGPVNEHWADEFKWLFARRDASVHPEEKPQPSDRHPAWDEPQSRIRAVLGRAGRARLRLRAVGATALYRLSPDRESGVGSMDTPGSLQGRGA
jgi:hypothetical protein